MEVNKRFLTILTPEGEFLRTRNHNLPYRIGEEIDFSPEESNEKKKFLDFSAINTFKGKMILTTAAAIFLISSFTILPLYQNNKVYAYMSIDINPSIELGINSDFEVIELNAYNDDGEKVLAEIGHWENEEVEIVVSEIMFEIKDQGYMKKNDALVISTVYVQEDMTENNLRLEEEVKSIKDTINQDDVNLTLIEGTLEEREKAKEAGLTTGLYKDNSERKPHKDTNIGEIEEPSLPKTIQPEEKPPVEEDTTEKEPPSIVVPNTPPGQLKKEEKVESAPKKSEGITENRPGPPGQAKKVETPQEQTEPTGPTGPTQKPNNLNKNENQQGNNGNSPNKQQNAVNKNKEKEKGN
jgi:hypothetical protein